MPSTTITIPINIEGASARGLPQAILVTWQERVRLGQSFEARLQLPAVEGVDQPATAQAQAVLELNDAIVEPGFELRQTVTPGRAVTFIWQVAVQHEGNLQGRMWFFWNVTIDGKEERLPVLARPVELSVDAILGLPVWVVQIFAAGGVIGGVSLWLLKPLRLWRKRK